MYLKSFVFLISLLCSSAAFSATQQEIQKNGDMIAIGAVCMMFALGWIAGQQR